MLLWASTTAYTAPCTQHVLHRFGTKVWNANPNGIVAICLLRVLPNRVQTHYVKKWNMQSPSCAQHAPTSSKCFPKLYATESANASAFQVKCRRALIQAGNARLCWTAGNKVYIFYIYVRCWILLRLHVFGLWLSTCQGSFSQCSPEHSASITTTNCVHVVLTGSYQSASATQRRRMQNWHNSWNCSTKRIPKVKVCCNSVINSHSAQQCCTRGTAAATKASRGKLAAGSA